HIIIMRLINNSQSLYYCGQIPYLHSFPTRRSSDLNNGIVDVLKMIKKKLLTLPLTEKKINQLYDALTIIEKESFQEKPQSTIIQGMLAHLRTVPELAEESEQIASLFDIELLD